jgi:hypothetical protein
MAPNADTFPQIVMETSVAAASERQGRITDIDGGGLLGKKKCEGYFRGRPYWDGQVGKEDRRTTIPVSSVGWLVGGEQPTPVLPG